MNWQQVINTPNFVWSTATRDVLPALNKDYPFASSLLLHNAIFNLDAAAYQDFLTYVTSQLLPFSSIAEYGCGNGALLYYFANEYNATVVGCDISTDLIDSCKAIMPGAIFDAAIKFTAADDTVDYCLSNSVFQYFESEEYAADVITEMQRISNKGIFITDIKSAEYETEFKQLQADRQHLTMSQLDEKYRTTPLRFYNKDFFAQFGNATFLPMPTTYPDSALHSFSVLIR
jgi:SAM-dependent methyltransferase